MELDLNFKEVRVNFHNEENKPWSIGVFNDFVLSLAIHHNCSEGKIVCSSGRIEYPEHPLCTNIVNFKENALNCSFFINSIGYVKFNMISSKV